MKAKTKTKNEFIKNKVAPLELQLQKVKDKLRASIMKKKIQQVRFRLSRCRLMLLQSCNHMHTCLIAHTGTQCRTHTHAHARTRIQWEAAKNKNMKKADALIPKIAAEQEIQRIVFRLAGIANDPCCTRSRS